MTRPLPNLGEILPRLGERVKVVDIDGEGVAETGQVVELRDQLVYADPRGNVERILWALRLRPRPLEHRSPRIGTGYFAAGAHDQRIADCRGPVPVVLGDDGVRYVALWGWLKVTEEYTARSGSHGAPPGAP